MKKMKKLLCVLLAMVLMLGSTSVGASAIVDYTKPDHYNSLGKPVFSYEQSCSMLLDWLDALLYEMNINENIDIVVAKIQLNLTSINNTYASIDELMDKAIVGFADAFNILGDITDLNKDAIANPRRGDSYTDSQVFYALLQFLYDNAALLEKLVNTTMNWGILDTFLKPADYPYLYDLPNFLKEQIYIMIYNNFTKPESEADITALPTGVTLDSFTIDGLLQDVVDGLLVGEYNVSTQSYTGFLPSMKGHTSITVGSTYDLIQNVIDAAMADILVPMLMDMLPEVLSIETSAEWPNGNPEAPGLLPTIVGVINDYLKLGYQYDPEEYPVIELHNCLTWLLVGEEKTNAAGELYRETAAIYEIFAFTDHGVDINDALMTNIKGLLRSLGPGLLQMIFDDEIPEDMEFPDMTNYTTDQFISYIVCLIAPFTLPDVRILPDCDTVQECLTYILISLVVDILPENDYYGQIANGTLDPEHGAWIEVGVDYLIYLVNSLIDVNIPADANLNEFISYLADWLIANFGFIFNTRQDYANMTGWEKLDNTIFTLLDPTLLTIQQADGKTVSESLIVNTILTGVQEFDIEKILSFVGKNSYKDAVLNMGLVEFVLDLLGRILSGLMNGNTIIPERATRLETLVVGEGGAVLGDFVYNLLTSLYTEREYNFPTLIPLIGSLIGLSVNDNYTVYAPTGYPNKSITDLQKLVNQYAPSNDGLKYTDDGYVTMGEEDYEYLYEYTDFEDTLKDCKNLIEKYQTAPYEVTSLEIKNLYYRLGYYHDRLTAKSSTCKTQLFREIDYANKNVAASNEQEDGSKLYTDRSWRLYQEALANANKVYDDSSAIQSKITKARQELFKAQNQLKDYVGLANYRVLDARITQALNKVSEENYRLYTTDSIARYKTALKNAQNLERDYDVDDQAIVDKAATELAAATSELTLWEINYELGADITIDSVVAQDSNTVLKFRESSGAAVTDVSATVDNGAVIGEMYEENGYYCWTIEPGTAPLYSVINAKITFTQPSTGKTYVANAYTFVSAGYEVNIDVNTCKPGYIRNAYLLDIYGINDASISSVTYHYEHDGVDNAPDIPAVPTAMVYVDTSVYQDLSQIPGLMFTLTKDVSSYDAANIGSGTFSSVNAVITSSNPNVTLSTNSYDFTLNQTSVKNITFAGKVPAAGTSMTSLIELTVTASATNGGKTISTPKFNLRVTAYDKSQLRATVADAIAACRQQWFYSGGWDIYSRDLNKAVHVLNNPLVTQAEIDEANSNLLEAIDWLEYSSADYKELHKLISVANSLDPHDYKDFSGVTAVLNSIDYNKGLLEQSLIDETVKKLRAAMDALKPAQSAVYIRCYDKSGNQIVTQSATEVSLADGSNVQLIKSDIIYGNVGEKIIINVPQIMGYSSTNAAQLVTITNDGLIVEFYYTADEYTIRLNTNGGKIDTNSVAVKYGQTYADLPVPTRDGYVFAGWYTKLSGGMKVDENTRVTTGYYKTLYAHWDDAPETESSDIATDSASDSEVQVEETKELSIFDRIIAAISQLIGLLLSNVFGIG